MANNQHNPTKSDWNKSLSSDVSSQEVENNESRQTKAKNDENLNADSHNTTKEGELLPKTRSKLEEVIRSKGITGFTIDISPGSAVGDNYLGFIGRVIINGQDKNGKSSTWYWIVKTAPTQDIYRNVLNIEFLYAREVYVYEKIFPVFHEFQKEKLVASPFNHYPQFIFSHLERYSESFAMEDMKHKGYVMRNRRETLDCNHVELVMEAYAKMHAVSYALKNQKPDLFDDFKANTKDSMAALYSKESANSSLTTSFRSALETLDMEKDEHVYAKFEKLVPRFVDVYLDLVSNPTEYSVIGHGDSWVNNMLWLYDDPLDRTIPKKVCLLDFQLCRYGSPACDLSYFIFTCTEKALRDEHYDDMIKIYYKHLCAHLAEMGTDPEICLPFSVLEEELKRFAVIGLYFTLLVLPIITKDAEEMPNLKDDDVKLEDVQERWRTKSKHYDEYRERVRGCLTDFSEKGYFDYHIR